MARTTDARSRMISSAIDLLRERGVNGVTVDAVLASSGAPRGSVYHHFPGGRSQLVLEAAEASAEVMTTMIRSYADVDATTALQDFAALWKDVLVRSDFRAGCPVAALVNETSTDLSGSVDLAGQTFSTWVELLATTFADDRRTRAEAEDLALTVVATVEGAITMCRAQRSVRPLDVAVAQLIGLL